MSSKLSYRAIVSDFDSHRILHKFWAMLNFGKLSKLLFIKFYVGIWLNY